MPYTEIDHNGPEHVAVEEFRRDIEPLLLEIVDVFHDRQPVAAGKQWTIPISTSCGLRVRLILQVDDLGECEVGIDD